MIEVGKIYRHYKKGDRYKVLYVGTNSETLEEMVVYQSLKDNKIWVRPSKMWGDTIPENKRTEFGQDIRFKPDYLQWHELEDISC